MLTPSPTLDSYGYLWWLNRGAAAKPHYLVINADESEPGTCKDIPLLMMTPHFLIEGAIIAAYAIRAAQAAAPSSPGAGAREREWQRRQLPDEVRSLVLEDQARRSAICWGVFTD